MAPLYLTMALVIREPSNRPSALKKHWENFKKGSVLVFEVAHEGLSACSCQICLTSHRGRCPGARYFQRELWSKWFLRISLDSIAAYYRSTPAHNKHRTQDEVLLDLYNTKQYYIVFVCIYKQKKKMVRRLLISSLPLKLDHIHQCFLCLPYVSAFLNELIIQKTTKKSKQTFHKACL